MMKSFQEILDYAKWKPLFERVVPVNSLMPKDEIHVGFYINKVLKDKDRPNEMRITIGEFLVEKLGWKKGDKILVLFDPDNLCDFLLVKAQQGRKLSQQVGMRSFNLMFAYPHCAKIGISEIMTKRKAMHTIVTDSVGQPKLYFRIDVSSRQKDV